MIEIPHARSKPVDEFRDATFDVVITVCDSAAEECPVWLGQGRREHISLPDPAQGSLDNSRQVRDGIQEKALTFLDAYGGSSDSATEPGTIYGAGREDAAYMKGKHRDESEKVRRAAKVPARFFS